MAKVHIERTNLRAVAGGAIGSAMEWYDFGLYAFFAPILARLFFPSTDKLASLLATFAAFAAGFLMRPVGALIFGYAGDRIGRRRTLAAAVILMAVPTFVTGLLPTYAAIGILAPMFLILMRMLQGVSAGGEAAGAFSFLSEHSAPGRRGFTSSFASATAVLGFLMGSAMGTLLTSALSPQALDAWGWRIAFLLGIAVGGAGLYVRARTRETPHFEAVQQEDKLSESPILEVLRFYRQPLLTAIGIQLLPGAAFFLLLSYMPSYLSEIAGLPLATALRLNTAALALCMPLVVFGGALSDRFGRRPVLLIPGLGFLVLSYPLFAVEARGQAGSALAAQLLFAALVALALGTALVAGCELFPTRVRYTGDSLALNLAFAVFGGTGPLIATYLITRTGNATAPAVFLVGCAVLELIALAAARETAHSALS